MNLKLLTLLLLAAITILPSGCASEDKGPQDDSSIPPMEAVQSPNPPSHDDSNGWGANIQNASEGHK